MKSHEFHESDQLYIYIRELDIYGIYIGMWVSLLASGSEFPAKKVHAVSAMINWLVDRKVSAAFFSV